MPPRHGKSERVSRIYPAWFVGNFPNKRVILASYEADFAASWGAKARDVLLEHGRSVFRVWLRPGSVAANRWDLARYDGGMVTAGVGGPVTGKGADLFILDDPVKNAEEAGSKTMRERAWDWWRSTAYTRLEPGGAVILMMTRWHEDDLGGRILAEAAAGGERWEVVRLPALAEEWDPLRRSVGAPLWRERYDLPALEEIRRTIGGYWWACTPYQTPITMADWTEKPVGEVLVGDRVLGFERGTPSARARLVVSEVVATHSTEAAEDVYELTLESGHTVRCTIDHRWYTGRAPSVAEPHRRMDDVPKVGRPLVRLHPFADPESDQRRRELWSWLAGIVDGEGCCQPNVLVISQSPDANPDVFARTREVLGDLGLGHVERVCPYPAKPGWGRHGAFVVHDAKTTYLKLIRYAHPAKAGRMATRLLARGHMWGIRDRVVSIRKVSRERVYALTTTTGNYFAWGCASSNSMYQQRPAPAEGGLFKRTWFRRYAEEPTGVYRLEGGEVVALDGLRRFGTVDLAASTRETADFTVVAAWGATADGKLLLLDLVRERLEGPDIVPVVARAVARWRLGFVGVEKVGFQLALLQQARREGLPVRELIPDHDKVARALPATAALEAERVFFPRAAPWLADLEAELLAFPTGAHDDAVDALSYAVHAQAALLGIASVEHAVPALHATPLLDEDDDERGDRTRRIFSAFSPDRRVGLY